MTSLGSIITLDIVRFETWSFIHILVLKRHFRKLGGEGVFKLTLILTPKRRGTIEYIGTNPPVEG